MKIMNHLYTIIWMRNREEQRERERTYIQKPPPQTQTQTQKIPQQKQMDKKEKTYSSDDIEKLLLIM